MSRNLKTDQLRITIDLQDFTGRLFTTLHSSFGDMQPSSARLGAKLVAEALVERFKRSEMLQSQLEAKDRMAFQSKPEPQPKPKARRASK